MTFFLSLLLFAGRKGLYCVPLRIETITFIRFCLRACVFQYALGPVPDSHLISPSNPLMFLTLMTEQEENTEQWN